MSRLQDYFEREINKRTGGYSATVYDTRAENYPSSEVSGDAINFSDNETIGDYVSDMAHLLGRVGASGTGMFASDTGGLLQRAAEYMGAPNNTLGRVGGWLRNEGEYLKNTYDPTIANPNDSTAIKIANLAVEAGQSLPESLALMAAGALVGNAAGGAAGAAVTAARATALARKAYDIYQGGSKAAKIARSAVQGAKAVKGTVGNVANKIPGVRNVSFESVKPSTIVAGTAQSGLEGLYEGQQGYDDYINTAKRNGTYVPGVTEREAEEIAAGILKANTIGLLGTNTLQQHLIFGNGSNGSWKRKALGLLGTMGAEAAEEDMQSVIQKLNAANKGHVPLSQYADPSLYVSDDALHAAAVGAIMGGGMHVVGKGGQNLVNRLFPKPPTPNADPNNPTPTPPTPGDTTSGDQRASDILEGEVVSDTERPTSGQNANTDSDIIDAEFTELNEQQLPFAQEDLDAANKIYQDILDGKEITESQEIALLQMADEQSRIPQGTSQEDLAFSNTIQQAIEDRDLKLIATTYPDESKVRLATLRNMERGGKEYANVEAQIDHIDALKENLQAQKQAAIANNDYAKVTQIDRAINSGDVAAMERLATPMPTQGQQQQAQSEPQNNLPTPSLPSSNATDIATQAEQAQQQTTATPQLTGGLLGDAQQMQQQTTQPIQTQEPQTLGEAVNNLQQLTQAQAAQNANAGANLDAATQALLNANQAALNQGGINNASTQAQAANPTQSTQAGANQNPNAQFGQAQAEEVGAQSAEDSDLFADIDPARRKAERQNIRDMHFAQLAADEASSGRIPHLDRAVNKDLGKAASNMAAAGFYTSKGWERGKLGTRLEQALQNPATAQKAADIIRQMQREDEEAYFQSDVHINQGVGANRKPVLVRRKDSGLTPEAQKRYFSADWQNFAGREGYTPSDQPAPHTQSTQTEQPSAQSAGREGEAQWRESHKFTYDQSKTVDENIAEAERLAKEYIRLFGETDQIDTPERQQLRKNIADELYGDGAKTKNREAFLIVGLPAAGKSTFSDPLVEEQGALLIDADEAKKRLPEFSDGLLATAVHEESANIANDVLTRATENGDNIVMPVVGKTYESLMKRISDLKKENYKVRLIYVDLPLNKAIERVKARFQSEGRLVSPTYLQSVGLKPKQNYDKIKQTKGVDEYEAWNNDVRRGDPPLLIERSPQTQQTAETSGMGRLRNQRRRMGQTEPSMGDASPAQSDASSSSLNNSRLENQGGFSTPQNTEQESKPQETRSQKLARLQGQVANLIDMDNANGNTEAANEKYAAIVNQDIPAMERMVQESQDNLLLTMSDISLAMAEPQGSNKTNSNKAKKERQAQVEAILRLQQNPLIAQYATKPLKFNKNLRKDLRAGKIEAIRYAQKQLREAGITPSLATSEQAQALRRDILNRQRQDRREQRPTEQQSTPQTQEETQSQTASETQETQQQTAEEQQTPTAENVQEETQTSQEQAQEETPTKTEPQNKPAKQKTIPGYTGKEATVTTDSGKKVKIRYRIVPADRLVTSHKFNNGQPSINKAYPQELQPRDRQRVSMGLQIVEMANKLNAEELGDSRNLNQGAPIIRSDGVVLNGNGRVMAIRKAQSDHNKPAQDYKKWLINNAKRLGITAKQLNGNHLILVREVVDELDEATTKEITTSTTGGSRMGASEQAKTDADKITTEDLERYAENESGDLTTANNQGFVSGILHRIVSKNDVNAYTDKNGYANPDGIQRVKRAVFSAAYNDDHLIAKMAESTDDNIRNISNGLMSAAPRVARLNKLMERGERHEYPLAKTIAEAVKKLDHLRNSGQTVENYLNEQSMFSEHADTEETREILRTFDEFKRSGKKIARFLNRMTELINRQGDPNQTSLMGDTETASLMDIIERSREDARNGDASESLFGDNGVKFSFAGEKSQTAPLDRLQEAKQLEAEGWSAEGIWYDTGWKKGKDGKWRYEIPDNLNKIDTDKLQTEGKYTLGEVYDNPELYNAYPMLRGMSIIVKDIQQLDWNGFFISGTQSRIARWLPRFLKSKVYNPGSITINSKSPGDVKETLLHELQHAIQTIEGFARGGDGSKLQLENYQRTGGEQEAREVEKRLQGNTNAIEFEEAFEKAQNDIAEHRKTVSPEEQKLIDRYMEAWEEDEDTESLKEGMSAKTLELLDKFEDAGGNYSAYGFMPPPTIHTDDAIIVFNGEEFALSVKSPIDNFRDSFDNTTKRLWSNKGVSYSKQREIFDDVTREVDTIIDRMEKATHDDEIDAIREELEPVLREVVRFNEGGIFEDMYAVRAHIAREVFENHEKVHQARARVGGHSGQLNQSGRDTSDRAQGRNELNDARNGNQTRQDEQQHSGTAFVVSGERDNAEKRYKELYNEQRESDKKLHAEEFRASGTNLSPRQQNTDSAKADTPKHSNKGAFSIAQNGQSATVDKSVAKNLQKGLAVIAQRLGGTYNHAAGRYDFKDKAALEEFTDAANSLLKILDPETAAKYSIVAWHGSPHNFEEFSLTAIGTGEGAQVHGYGLYFAKNREVSEGYRDRLAGNNNNGFINAWIGNTQYWQDFSGIWRDSSNDDNELDPSEQAGEIIALEAVANYEHDDVLPRLRELLDEVAATEDGEVWANDLRMDVDAESLEEAIDWLEEEGFSDRGDNGSLLQVEIPNEDVMLDEQKTFEEQSDKVKKAIKSIIPYAKSRRDNDLANIIERIMANGEYTGREIYEKISSNYGARLASIILNKHGIKGITYEGGRDGRCYVVFDDKAIEITARYSAAADEAQKLLKTIKIVEDADLTKAQSKFVQLGKEMGTTIVWYDGDSRLNGVQSGNVILLNRKGNADLTKTFWHETYHWIKSNNQDLASQLVKAVQEAGIITEEQIEAYRKLTSRRDLLTDEAVIEEMLADEFVNPAKAHDLMNKLAKADEKNIPLVQRVIAYLKKLADRFVEFMQGSRVKPGVKFSEADNALPMNERVLTTKQRDAFINAVGKLADSITDSKGRKIFKVTDRGKGITLADGKVLPEVATNNIGTYSRDDNDIRFSLGRGKTQNVELYEVTGDEDDIANNWKPRNDVSYRFYTTQSPMSSTGFAMFADDPDSNNNYGSQAYIVKHEDLTPVEDVQEMVRSYLRDLKEQEDKSGRAVPDDIVDEYFRDDDYEIDLEKAEDIIRELAPEDIVNSAEVFDNADLLQWLCDRILVPNDILGIKTPDGALAFDESIIEPDFEASVYYAQLGDKILPPSNIKFSIRGQKTVDSEAQVVDNSGRKFSLKRHIHPEHNRVQNKIVLNDTRTGIVSIELGLPVDPKETHDEALHRRMREIEGIDYTLVNEGGNSAYVNLVPKAQQEDIAQRLDNGVDPSELILHYKTKFNEMVARYADGLSEEKRIGYALLLKGAAYYVAERTGVSYNAERGGGIFDDGTTGVSEQEEVTHQNRIREVSRSEEDGFSNARSIADLKREASEAFPNAKITERGNTLQMEMPNGQKVTVTLVDELTATDAELSKAKKAHGINEGATVTIEGYAETVGGEGFVALSQGSREGTGFHEAYHIAEAMAFAPKELADAERLIDKSDEKRADKYAEWVQDRKNNRNFAKLWQKIKDMAAKLAGLLGHETQHNLFRKVESGEVYERENVGRDTARRYSVSENENSFKNRVSKAMDKLLDKTGMKASREGNLHIDREAKGEDFNSLWDSIKTPKQLAKKSSTVAYFYRLGKKAMATQEHLRNEFSQEMEKFRKLTKNKEDLEKVSSVLWQEDAESKEFTIKELKEMGLSENAIKARQLVREQLKKAYELINDARMQVKIHSKTMTHAELEEFKKSKFVMEIKDVRPSPEGQGKLLVTYKGPKTWNDFQDIPATALAQFENDDYIQVHSYEQNKDGSLRVYYTECIKPVGMRKGYIPHFFHQWRIYEKVANDNGQYTDENGNRYNLVLCGSERTLADVVDRGNELARNNRDKEFVVRPQSFSFSGGERMVAIGDMDFERVAQRLADSTTMNLAEANKFLSDNEGLGKANRHRFLGNLLERKGAKGYETDLPWALSHYFMSASRFVAMEEFKPDAISAFNRRFGAFDKEYTVRNNGLANYIKNYINDINGNPTSVEALMDKVVDSIPGLKTILGDYYPDRPALQVMSKASRTMVYAKLGVWNVSSAFLNLAQFINIGARLNSYEYALRGLKKALKPTAQDLAIIKATGVLDNINQATDAGGYTQHRSHDSYFNRAKSLLGKVNSGLEWLGNKSMLMFQAADILMRKAAVIGAYYQGVEKLGMRPNREGTLSRKAINYAIDVNDDSNFDYSVVNTPNFIRRGSVLTQMAFQFQKYPINQLEFVFNHVIKGTTGQKVRFLVPYLLCSGLCGAMPLGDLLDDLLAALFGTDIAQECKQEMLHWAGKDPVKQAVANFAMYGAPSFFGIDVSKRVGMANFFSGESYGERPENTWALIGQQVGGSAVSTLMSMHYQMQQGNPVETIKAFSPGMGNVLQAIVGETHTSRGRVGTVYESAYERLVHALGFRNVNESNEAIKNNYRYASRKQQQEMEKRAIDDYIANPSEANRQVLIELGISKKRIENERKNKTKSAKERKRDSGTKKQKKSEADYFEEE